MKLNFWEKRVVGYGENKKVAVGGDYHMETCEFLTSIGEQHKNVWGLNLRYLVMKI